MVAREYRSMVALNSVTTSLETHVLFGGPARPEASPIDELIENTNVLNTLAAQHAQKFTNELGSLLLLGYMSAVESFIRALIRELVNFDEVARRLSEPELVSFGAALNHKSTQLAEALLEAYSFAGRENVTKALNSFLGLKNIAKDFGPLLDEYQKICELRHCCAHRFGRLGVKNAIALGLASHKECLDKPLSLDYDTFSEMALRLRTFAKGLNNIVCGHVLDRTARNKNDHGKPLYRETWTWNWQKDRRRFTGYYRIFATTKDTIPSPALRDVYNSFRAEHKKKK
jgi:hypothetical protein